MHITRFHYYFLFVGNLAAFGYIAYQGYDRFLEPERRAAWIKRNATSISMPNTTDTTDAKDTVYCVPASKLNLSRYER